MPTNIVKAKFLDPAMATDAEVTAAIAGLGGGGGLSNPTSEVAVSGGNGNGSTNNKIRRFSTIDKNIGSDITYADSASLGNTFTINTNGVYAISYLDDWSGGPTTVGISVNTSAINTDIRSVTYAQGKRASQLVATAGQPQEAFWTGNLTAGDVVRAHNDSSPNETNVAFTMFSIVRVN